MIKHNSAFYSLTLKFYKVISPLLRVLILFPLLPCINCSSESLRYKAFYQEYESKHKAHSPAPHGTYIPVEGKNSIFLITLNKMSVNRFDKW